jgi:hypothetical protein
MAIQTINLGTFANDGTGDDLRIAFEKVNNNFSEIDNSVVVNGQNLGSGTAIFAGKSANAGLGENLTFKSLIGGQNITLSSASDSITINAATLITQVADDQSPQLGGDLDLNNFAIVNYSSPGVYGTIQLNGLRVSQNSNIVTVGNFVYNHSLIIDSGTSLTIAAGTDLILNAGPGGNISVTGEVFFNDSINADVIGSLVGEVIGTVYGTVTDISNHDLSDLGDVSNAAPSVGQALIWNGIEWAPGQGTGSGGSGNDAIDWEFPPFDGGYTNPIQFLLDQYSFDYGTFSLPTGPEVNLGTF